MSLPDRLSSLSSATEKGPTELRRDSDGFDNPGSLTAGGAGLVQRCVIIQKDERGYGLTVSGDNPVYVASVKPEGAAAKAGVQRDDRIVKVNGTLVTSKNHIDVVKLIKSGSYVALTLMGRPNSATSPGGSQPGSSPFPSRPASTSSNRDSTLITAPRPVDPNKDKELLQQKVHMTQVMFEQAKEDFEKHQRQYVKTPSERLHTQLLEKERTVKTLENQLKQLTGVEDPTTPSFTQGSQRFDLDSDFSSLSSKATSYPSEGSMSDSPHTSPSISPTPVHPDNHIDDLSRGGDSGVEDSPVQPAEIITIDDEDVNSDDEPHLGIPRPMSGQRPVSPFLTKLQTAETCDTGPFSDIRLLEKKPAHMGVFLHYLISNSDPNALFFYIVTSTYKESGGNSKDLRKWGYEIFSTFLAPGAPLHVEVGEVLVTQVNEQLSSGPGKSENENILRSMFDGCRAALSNEISDQLADFRSKRDLGLGNIFGVHELKENMDKGKEIKMIEKYLMPHLTHCTQVTPQGEKETGRKLTDRDVAFGWALATFLRQVGVSKTSSSGGILERMQSFIMKDKRGFKIPGSRSAKAKTVKGHQFNLNHFLVPTFCAKCEGLIWGVGYQGFICQSCEMGIHKQCVEDIQEACSGKKRGKRASGLIPVLSTRKPSNPNQQAGQPYSSVAEALGQASLGIQGETRSPPADATGPFPTQPFRSRGDDDELASVPKEHSVKSIVDRYQELTSPTGPGPGEGELTTNQERKGSTDLSRSESLKGKGDKTERPPRRAKSDVDSNDMFKAISQQSGSSSTSSLSNRSVESPSASTDNVNDALAGSRTQQYDSDLEVEELPPLKQVLGEDVCKKLKPKEKKRQEVINELFHTERAHLRNLKVLDILFNQPMLAETGVLKELARSLFPNIEEIITLHSDLNTKMKERRNQNSVVGDVGDLLLGRFDGEEGDRFRKACAEYCRNQSYALEALKRHRRKDQRIAQFLGETEADKLCRKLELKDQVPCEMQRLTKYPMLIENLMKYTQSPSSEEYKNLETALERSKKILAYVNQAVRECENYHKLKEWQKKLDKRAIDNSSDPFLKELDLTRHKLVHDGFLVWRLRSHRLIELQVLLLEDILVLLQRVDDRLVLKCQSTNQQSIGNEYKYTHSPVLKLQNLLARNVATDKKAFFVINTSDTGPQIYELVAPTQDARKTWCKLINEKAEEHKRGITMNNTHMGRVTKSTPSPQPDEITMVRSRIMRKSQEPSPPPADEGQAAAPAFVPPEHENVENVGSLATADYQPELIQPDQINVSGAVTAHAQPVLSPLDGTRAMLNVAVEQEQITEMEEAVKPLVTGVLPQETTAGPTPDEDSDDPGDMYPENLPLPDDSSISADTAYSAPISMETREEEDGGGSSVDAVESDVYGEPMTTDLDEGGEGEDGRSTPTPSPTPMGTVEEEEDGREEEEEGDTDSIITISTDGTLVGSEDGHPLKAVAEEQQQEGGQPLDNNNTSSQDSELTNPIDV